MFENPGEKLKSFATVNFILGVIGTITLAFIYSDFALLLVVVGLVASYFPSLLMYGFGELIENTKNNMTVQATVSPAEMPVATIQEEPIENREELLAAISAALAEELGTDVSAIRILSFKKVS